MHIYISSSLIGTCKGFQKMIKKICEGMLNELEETEKCKIDNKSFLKAN